MSDIAELKRLVKSLQQASSQQVRPWPSRSIRLIYLLILFDVPRIGYRRHPTSVKEGGKDN